MKPTDRCPWAFSFSRESTHETLYVILLLIGSNAFMTVAWYGHLKYKNVALWLTILVSWLIALPEYALQVPANRLGYGHLSATQLKVLQEVISLCVFAVFAFFYLKETPTWRTATAFALIVGAVLLIRGVPAKDESAPITEHATQS